MSVSAASVSVSSVPSGYLSSGSVSPGALPSGFVSSGFVSAEVVVPSARADPAACLLAASVTPVLSTTPAAVASTSTRRAPRAAGCPPYRVGRARAAARRCAAHPAQEQSTAGAYSSKAGTVMRIPSALVKIFGRICTGVSVQLSRHTAF